MIDALPSQLNGNATQAPVEETLRLKCPECGGGLNLKRRHLGIVGQCVHCQRPIRAIEENGGVRVVSEEPAPPVEDAPEPATAPPLRPLARVAESQGPAAPCQQPSEAFPEPAATSPAPMWSFPEPRAEESAAPAPEPFVEGPAPATVPGFAGLVDSAAGAPGHQSDGLFTAKVDFEAPPIAAPEPEAGSKPASLLFGSDDGFASPMPFLFQAKDEASPITPGWGTKVPTEKHASISPFGTGSAPSGGGFAETLFREKVVKEAGAKAEVPVNSPFAPLPSDGAAADSAVEKPNRDCEEKIILDGDGRPLRPMSKEEEEEFATNFFKYENVRSTPRWVKRLRKMAIRFLVFFCLVGGAVAGLAVFAPKEKFEEWKGKAIDWLEPGMAILDYLPENLRPDWLPQTEFGIDAGLDENGQPKKKLNAFEGLEKLKGDVGNMRGAAEAEMEKLKEVN